MSILKPSAGSYERRGLFKQTGRRGVRERVDQKQDENQRDADVYGDGKQEGNDLKGVGTDTIFNPANAAAELNAPKTKI